MGAFRYWWALKFQYALFMVVSIGLASLLIFFILQQQNNSRLHYSEIIFKTATSNSPISLEQIINPSFLRSLTGPQTELANLDAQQLVENLSLNRVYPQVDQITDQILNLDDATLKKLVLSGDQLENTVNQLTNLSRQHFALRLIHNQTSLSPAQSELILNRLIDHFNQKTSQDVDFQRTRLFTLQNISESDLQSQILLFEKLNAIRSNLRIIQSDYSELVTQTDFSILQTQINRLDQFLFQFQGIANDEITLRLENQVEELSSKLASLYEILELIQNNETTLPTYAGTRGSEGTTIAQINNDSIQSLLSLGKELSAVDLINQTAAEIKQLSFQKAELESQLQLNQRLKENLVIPQQVSANEVNQVITQLNELITVVVSEKNPDRYLNVTVPPRYFSDRAQLMQQFIRYALLTSILIALMGLLIYFIRFQFQNR
ncbi:MAG: hypothetical protein EBZ28_05160 [Alphaproteobacteria bacterium]|nr:hypothetical protein [Alphaproteobacteria bacterium]